MASNASKQQSKVERDRLRAFEMRQAAFDRKADRRKRDNRLWSLIAGAVILVAIAAQVGFSLVHTSVPTALPDKSLAQNKTWAAALGINGVDLTVQLDGRAAPQAVSSTLALARSGFYNKLTCHRLTTQGIYVLQCGDPKGDGSGGPGYSYGPVENAPANNVYPAGTIAMARQGNNASSQGSQFFIVYKTSTIPSDQAGGYTVIGQVTTGLDVLISQVVSKGVAGGGNDGKPVVPTTISYFRIAS